MISLIRYFSLVLLIALNVFCAYPPIVYGMAVVDDSTEANAEDFRFAVIGDTQPYVGPGIDVHAVNKYFLRTIPDINAKEPDFLVHVGDYIMGNAAFPPPYRTIVDIIEKEWDAHDEAVEKLTMPVHMVPGNHDIWNATSVRIWNDRRYGPFYYSWEHKGCHFVVLNTEDGPPFRNDLPPKKWRPRISDEQLEWLKHDLAKASSARRIFVFMHRPLWAYDNNNPINDPEDWNERVHPVLALYGVDTLFSGHWHEYCLHPKKDGVRYIITGGGGCNLNKPYEHLGGFHHFLTVDVKGESTRIKIIKEDEELPVGCVKWFHQQRFAEGLTVDPITQLNAGSKVEWTSRVTKSPHGREIVHVSVDSEGTEWKFDQEKLSTESHTHEEVPFELRATIGKSPLPLPKIDVKLEDGGKIIYHWDLSPDISRVSSYLMDWNIVGPFDLGPGGDDPGWSGLLPPEKEVDLGAYYTGKDGREIGWRTARAEEDRKELLWVRPAYRGGRYGFMSVDRFYDGVDHAVACAVAYVSSPIDATYTMSLESNDNILVRINGSEVWRNEERRYPMGFQFTDRDVFVAKLNEGWNEIFLKIADHKTYDGWGFYFRIVHNGREFEYATAPPR